MAHITDLSDAKIASLKQRRRRYTDAQPRWPAALSIFAAIGVSLVLWVGIIAAVGFAIARIGRLFG